MGRVVRSRNVSDIASDQTLRHSYVMNIHGKNQMLKDKRQAGLL